MSKSVHNAYDFLKDSVSTFSHVYKLRQTLELGAICTRRICTYRLVPRD